MIMQGWDLAPLFFLLYVCVPVMFLMALAGMEQIKWSIRTAKVSPIPVIALFIGCLLLSGHPILTMMFFIAPILMAVCLFECIRWLRRCTALGPLLITLLAAFWFGFALHFAFNIIGQADEL